MKDDEQRRRALQFAKNLVAKRIERNWTQGDLVRATSKLLEGDNTLNRSSFSRYESGDNLPRRNVLEAIAKALKCDPDDLLPTQVHTNTFGPNLVTEDEGMARVSLDLRLPLAIALQIVALAGEGSKTVPQVKSEKKES